MDREPDGGDMNNVTPLRRYADFRSGEGGQSELFGTDPRLWIEHDAWDEADIPRRPWIAPGYLMRGAVTVVSGPGSSGKSMLTVLWSVSMALDQRIGRFAPTEGCRTLIYNVEDDAHEQQRRLSAALRQFRAGPTALIGRLHRAGPTGIGTLLRVDPLTKRLVGTETLTQLKAHIEAYQPDVVFLDPMVELHDSEENDNTAIRAVMAELRGYAAAYQCAICLLHHSRKGVTGAAGDPDSLRGASAIVGAARVVLTVLTMDKDEAEKLGISADRRRDYFRIDGAKSNYTRLDEAEWFERVEHTLANQDKVAAATPWEPPSVWTDITPEAINLALDRIAAGPAAGVLYTITKRGGGARWVGNALIDMLTIKEGPAKEMISAWIKSGLLYETTYRDTAEGKERNGVLVNDGRRPT